MESPMNPLYAKVLKRYPDCPDLPPLPKSSARWSESDFEMFVASMGTIMPAGAATREEQSSKGVGGDEHPTFECAPRRRNSSEATSKRPSGESSVCDAPSTQPHIQGKGTADACLVHPEHIYMEDTEPQGLKPEAILAKFDKCRAAALQSLSGLSTQLLVKEYGVGILLSDLYFVMETSTPPALTSPVAVESEIDLPKMPSLPSRQRLVDSRGETVCSAVFGQLFVDMATGMLSSNSEAYNKVKRPCDDAFGRGLPTTSVLAVKKQLAAKLAREDPKQGRAFAPRKYLGGSYVVALADCDTYNTVYHPKAVSVCERACLGAGGAFACSGTTVFFCRFLSTLPPGSQLRTHIFADETEHHGTRALIVLEEGGVCKLVAFAVYGGPLPGVLYEEEFQAVTPKNAVALIELVQQGSSKSRLACDVSSLEVPAQPRDEQLELQRALAELAEKDRLIAELRGKIGDASC